MVGSIAVFAPTSVGTPAPRAAPIGGPLESRPHDIGVVAQTRARAYEIAKSELPSGTPRTAIMTAADEIFAYLMFGLKPAKVD